jgi:hypothetical protein
MLLSGSVMASARAQELPEPTPEGIKAVQELFDASVRDGGLKQVGQGREATWQIETRTWDGHEPSPLPWDSVTLNPLIPRPLGLISSPQPPRSRLCLTGSQLVPTTDPR